MKNSSIKSNFKVISSGKRDASENIHSSKAVKSTMSEQLIVPPARVWDRIEAILDKQDERRNNANNIIAASFGINSYETKPKKVYIAAVAGLSLLAGLVWIVA